jgi:hypothetical protein
MSHQARGKIRSIPKLCILDPQIKAQYDYTIRLCGGNFSKAAIFSPRRAIFSPGFDQWPKRARNGHSSPGGGASIGPSALDRRNGAVRSSVRSHHIVRLQHSALQRHHCRPEVRSHCFRQASAASVGRPPSLRVADQRVWRVREGSDGSVRARQRARDGALSRASAPRPCAAAF